MKNFKKLFLSALLTLSSTGFVLAMEQKPNYNNSSSSSQTTIILDDRPKNIQKEIDTKFKKVSNTDPNTWPFDGNNGFYGLFNLDEQKILTTLASKKNKNDIYIIDIGGGQGSWSQNAMDFLLENETCKKAGKHFHIFNVTGGKECDSEIKSIDNVTFYSINQFPIENIDEELPKRIFNEFKVNINLTHNVDFIVSRYTFLHLIDPFGSLKRMYNLLTPQQGILLSTGFNFYINDGEKTTIKIFPGLAQSTKKHSAWDILANTNTAALFMSNCILLGGLGQFLLMRSNDSELKIPLIYTDKLQKTEDGELVPVYKKTLVTQSNLTHLKFEKKTNENPDDPSAEEYGYCCDDHNQESKKLFEFLKQSNLFTWQ